MSKKKELFTKLSTVLPGSNSSTSAIYFTPLSMDALDEMHKYSVNEKLYEFFEFDVFKNKIETEEYINKLLKRMSVSKYKQTASYWFVRRASDNRLIGTAGLVNMNYDRKSIEWGYGVDPDLWGNGYVLKIQEDLKTYVFEILGLNRLYGITMLNNKRTIESVLAAGAKNEGIVRDYYCKNGSFIDGWQYSILAKDYYKARNTLQNETKITSKDVITVLAELLPQESISADTAMENTVSWDSLTHMNLMIKLKQRFGIDLKPSDIALATSVDAIVNLVHKR
jgi:RimJ/RimL family protein N-acetyltransferase/acyl carrier protein